MATSSASSPSDFAVPLWNPLNFVLRACALALLCTALYLLVRGAVFIYDLYAFLDWLEGLGG